MICIINCMEAHNNYLFVSLLTLVLYDFVKQPCCQGEFAIKYVIIASVMTKRVAPQHYGTFHLHCALWVTIVSALPLCRRPTRESVTWRGPEPTSWPAATRTMPRATSTTRSRPETTRRGRSTSKWWRLRRRRTGSSTRLTWRRRVSVTPAPHVTVTVLFPHATFIPAPMPLLPQPPRLSQYQPATCWSVHLYFLYLSHTAMWALNRTTKCQYLGTG